MPLNASVSPSGTPRTGPCSVQMTSTSLAQFEDSAAKAAERLVTKANANAALSIDTALPPCVRRARCLAPESRRRRQRWIAQTRECDADFPRRNKAGTCFRSGQAVSQRIAGSASALREHRLAVALSLVGKAQIAANSLVQYSTRASAMVRRNCRSSGCQSDAPDVAISGIMPLVSMKWHSRDCETALKLARPAARSPLLGRACRSPR